MMPLINMFRILHHSLCGQPIILKWMKQIILINIKIHMVLHCKDWINFKMTGQLSTDWTDASTSLTDIFTNKYVYEILDALDIAEPKASFRRYYPH